MNAHINQGILRSGKQPVLSRMKHLLTFKSSESIRRLPDEKGVTIPDTVVADAAADHGLASNHIAP